MACPGLPATLSCSKRGRTTEWILVSCTRAPLARSHHGSCEGGVYWKCTADSNSGTTDQKASLIIRHARSGGTLGRVASTSRPPTVPLRGIHFASLRRLPLPHCWWRAAFFATSTALRSSTSPSPSTPRVPSPSRARHVSQSPVLSCTTRQPLCMPRSYGIHGPPVLFVFLFG